MPKIDPLPPISGADDALLLLRVIDAPASYQARIAELQALVDKANVAITRGGKVEDIDALHQAALDDRRKATDELRAARDKAAEIVKGAFAARDTAVEEAKQIRQLSRDTEAALAAERAAWDREKAAQQDALRAQAEESTRALNAAHVAEAEAEAAQREWTEKRDRLRGAMA